MFACWLAAAAAARRKMSSTWIKLSFLLFCLRHLLMMIVGHVQNVQSDVQWNGTKPEKELPDNSRCAMSFVCTERITLIIPFRYVFAFGECSLFLCPLRHYHFHHFSLRLRLQFALQLIKWYRPNKEGDLISEQVASMSPWGNWIESKHSRNVHQVQSEKAERVKLFGKFFLQHLEWLPEIVLSQLINE